MPIRNELALVLCYLLSTSIFYFIGLKVLVNMVNLWLTQVHLWLAIVSRCTWRVNSKQTSRIMIKRKSNVKVKNVLKSMLLNSLKVKDNIDGCVTT